MRAKFCEYLTSLDNVVTFDGLIGGFLALKKQLQPLKKIVSK
tara:strand:+ start:341 stop:466 length:126 start_codon:yes stop_codon:yes gene_type:complete